jgi:hypothetical protein
MASEGDELTSLSYISYLERYATVQPATQQESIEAVINMPLAPGDRIDTAREARMEIMLADGNAVWVDEYTTLSLDAVAFSRDSNADQTALFLGEGTIMVEISSHRLTGEPLRIDGRSATVYLDDAGLYRLQSQASTGLRVEVWEGLAEASTVAGGVLVRAESAATVSDGELIGTETVLHWGDDFSFWVEQRRQVMRGDSSLYVDARYERQAAQLDNYGNWVYVGEHNTWAWQPAVDESWSPYTAGRWYWTQPGWSWVSYEPWGWLPYHYGSWYFAAGFGWVWSWQPYWSPAWVSWCWWPGYVGWCPYGYYWGWYWPSYGYYYGYPYDPYPGHPGGGGGEPPRRNAIPRPGSGGDGGPQEGATRRAALSRPNEVALDLNGRVRVAEMDRAGWNVISTRDFASPHLSRLVQPGGVALRNTDATGVVSSDPLKTQPPSTVRPSAELERVFRDVESRTTRDITPIMARDAGLRAEDALRLVQPTTYEAVSRRSAGSAGSQSPTARSTAPRATAPRGGAGAVGDRPVLTIEPASPLYRGGARPGTGASRPSTSAGGTRGTLSGGASGELNPFVPRPRPNPATAPSDGQSATSYLRGGSLYRSPSAVGSISRAPLSRVAPPSSGSVGRQGPVIVPRTAPSRTSPGASSGRSAPHNPTASVRAPSSAPRSSSGGGSARMSAPSSGGGAAAPRASAGSRRR